MIGSMARSSLANKKYYRSLLAGNDAVSYGAYELISTTILAATSSSVTFSSIPSTYKHLQVRATVRNANGGATYDTGTITINADATAANYYYHSLEGNGSGVNVPSANTNVGSLRHVATSLNTVSAFSAVIVDVLDYSSASKYKTLRTLSGQHNSTYSSYGVGLSSLFWKNTAAITSLSLSSAGGQWVIGSRFSLYGIKG